MTHEFKQEEITYIGVYHSSSSKIYTFSYNNLIYDVYTTFDNQVQFIRGQDISEELTKEEIELHSELEEVYNGNHTPIQKWIDTL